MTPLTRAALDVFRCDVDAEGHERLFLHAACHPSEGTRASYSKSSGILEIACRKCRKPVVQIQVAP